MPAAIGPQVPLAPPPFLVAEQAWQVPVHAVLQQKPSTQNVLVHSCAPVGHVEPAVFLFWHMPPLQKPPAAQLASVVQVVLHAAGEPPQVPGEQLTVAGVGVTQVPLPLQNLAKVSVVLEHDDAAHCVLDEYFRQAPVPSHMPSVPQEAAP